jgi:LPS O-antigen subunit length determinant protein (WzzB/FepE family)
MEPQILSFQKLSSMVQDPRLDLYSQERTRKPMEDVVRIMLARDLRITALNPEANAITPAFLISFSYPNNHKAQQVVQTLITRFFEEYISRQRLVATSAKDEKVNQIFQRKASAQLEVIDSPSLPEKADSPNRLAIAATGLGIGLLLGTIALFVRRPRTPALQPA